MLAMVLSSLTIISPVAADDGPGPHSTTARTVLAELFTGAACGPCVPMDYGLDGFIDDHTRTEAVALVYHRSIPGPDVLETSETVQRQRFYLPPGQGASTPNEWVDGIYCGVSHAGSTAASKAWFEQKYTYARQNKSQLSMEIDGLITTAMAGKVWINVTALEDPKESNLYMHAVIVRKTYGPYNGGNGVTIHHWVVRKMLPSVNGESFTISSGQTKPFTYTFDLSNDGYSDEDDIAVVAFVQSHDKTQVTSELYPRSRYIAPMLQSVYTDFRVVPNQPPVISLGQIETDPNPTEDDSVTFKVFYRDVDDYGDNGPTEAKVSFKNQTSGTLQHDLSALSGPNPWTVGKWLGWTTKLSPGTYTYRFNASDIEYFALGDTAWNSTQVVIKPRNKHPELYSPDYSPQSGDTSQIFRFQILYRDMDNEEAASAKIYINSIPHDMSTDSAGPWSDWVLYYYETTLSVGSNHKFYFEFSDGIDEVRFPAETASPNTLPGPFVEAPNNEPTLTAPLFSPQDGDRDTEFTFSVIYTDGEGDHPTRTYIYIDDVPFMMDGVGDYRMGVKFTHKTTLDLGTHMFYFIFDDGKHEVRLPTGTGALDGPTVKNLAPTAVIDLPSDGTRFTPDDLIAFNGLGSTDPEEDALTYLWTSDIQGDLREEASFEVRLIEGMHTITLTVEDAYGATHSTSIQLDVRPKLPHLYIEELRSDIGRPTEADPVRFTVIIGNDGEVKKEGATVTFLVDGTEAYSDKVSVSVGTTQEISFTWISVAGDHTITAEVDGEDEELLITVNTNKEPTADPQIYTIGEQVKFKPGEELVFKSNAQDGDGDELTYEWDWGDGTAKSSGKDATHQYDSDGTYTVTLTVIDVRGGSVVKTLEVVVEKPKKDESPGFGPVLVIGALTIALIGATAVRRRRH
jgi:hypothetical protein